MNIRIQSVKFDADAKLTSFIEQKLVKLEKFVEPVILAEVTLRLDKNHDLGNKIAVIKLEVPHTTLVAERQCHTFEEAVDECVDALKVQIGKEKDKHK